MRAIAVLAVMTYHAVPEWLPGGYAGVDVFFVISGYLITRIVAGDLAASRFSIWRFWERRVRRIMPPLLAMLTVTGLAAWLWLRRVRLRLAAVVGKPLFLAVIRRILRARSAADPPAPFVEPRRRGAVLPCLSGGGAVCRPGPSRPAPSSDRTRAHPFICARLLYRRVPPGRRAEPDFMAALAVPDDPASRLAQSPLESG